MELMFFKGPHYYISFPPSYWRFNTLKEDLPAFDLKIGKQRVIILEYYYSLEAVLKKTN